MTPPASEQTTPSSLRLAEVVAALSLATDLGTGHPLERSLRACLLGVHFGAALGMSEAELSDLYYLSLLRWAGCTADSHRAEVFEDEIALGPQIDAIELWNADEMLRFLRATVSSDRLPDVLATGIQRTQVAAVAHCEVAQNIAARCGLAPAVREALGQIFERWDGRGVPGQVQGDALQRTVRVMHIVMDAELFHRLGGEAGAVAAVRQRAGGFYDPALAERFASDAPKLFRLLDRASAWEAVLDAEPGPRRSLTEPELDAALTAMADFTDLRSPSMRGHSPAVARLAEAAARGLGLPAGEVTSIRRAGLIHEVGMAGVPLLLCERAGPLGQGDWDRLRLHPYYAERVLARSPGLARLGATAGLHHERLDGSGYHRGLPASLLPAPARLLAAADVYQALTESRPYRPAFAAPAAADELRREARAGRLDGDAVAAVLEAAGHRPARASRERVAGLTQREIQVLQLVARSRTNKQIAQALTLSERTVDHHIRHIYRKIGVSTRAAAAMFAMQHHLLSD